MGQGSDSPEIEQQGRSGNRTLEFWLPISLLRPINPCGLATEPRSPGFHSCAASHLPESLDALALAAQALPNHQTLSSCLAHSKVEQLQWLILSWST